MNIDNLPGNVELRTWQQEFLGEFFATTLGMNGRERSPNFLLVATPGAGKTWAQLSTAYILKSRGLIDWIIVCVPTDHLRNQMGRDAAQNFGLDLYHATGFVPLDEFHGEVVTYAQVAQNPDLWRSRCSNKQVMLCSDEVHHLGDDLAWGEKYKAAFEAASYRLSTSGTPFRTDNQQIPWVRYEQDDDALKSISDYEYGYGRAVKDGVCRHVIFPTFDAKCQWQYGFNIYEASFSDALSKQLASHRRNTVIDAESEWINHVFCEANSRLACIREDGHDEAAGLVVCKDKNHAAKISELIHKKTGIAPLLVTSDNKDASDKIEEFATERGEGSSRWIVAVKMVSEGVDIKRLRVAIYASNIMTEMYFRQFTGRVIRMIGGNYEETAYVYVYPDEQLLSFIQRIKEEIKHEFTLKDNEDTKSRKDSANKGQRLNFFLPVEAQPSEADHFWDQKRFGIVEVNAVKSISREMNIPEVKILELLKRGQELGLVNIDRPEPETKAVTRKRESKTDRKSKARSICHKYANKLAFGMLNIESTEVHNKWTPLPVPNSMDNVYFVSSTNPARTVISFLGMISLVNGF
ncbi:MAG: DEAD/DEAH box helicase family protein, partial [Leptolyngbya sp. SIO3F4]|nr:DEAD/DEAH box helicase family protein [Leptolyngbya sp. SIO3F4]